MESDDRNFRASLRNADAEIAMMSGLLVSGGEALSELQATSFRAEMLWDESHQEGFRGMCRLHQRREPITYTSLLDVLGVGYTEYVLTLCGYNLSSAVYVPHYASLVRREWKKRRMVDVASSMVANVDQGQESLQAAIADLTELKPHSRGREMTAGEAITAMHSQEYVGISTGYRELDVVTGGFVPTHLWVVDAFTSAGKTTYALNLVTNLLKGDNPVLYFSLEQSIEELMLRLISIRSGVPGAKIRRRGDEDRERIAEAEDYYARKPLVFFDDLYDMGSIEAKVEHHSKRNPGGVAFLDYLQNLRWDDMFKVMSGAIMQAQALAKRIGVTMVVLSQISNLEAQQKDVGRYYGQKGSGAIRDTADKVLRLKRERGATELAVHLLKNRQGPAGHKFDLHFDLETGRIGSAVWEPLEF